MLDEKKTEEEIKLAEETKADEIQAEEKFESETEKRLAKTFDESDDDSTPEEKEEKPAEESTEEKEESAEKPTDDSTEKSDETDDSTPVEEESTEEKPAEESDKLDDSTSKDDSTDEPKLSEAYYRAAIHQGWKPEEIKDFLGKDSGLATRTFAKIYDSTNKLSREFATIGRTKQELAKKDVEPVKKDEPPKTSEFKEIDIDKLRKDYDNDPVVELVAQQQEQNKALYDQVQGMTKESDPSVRDEATIRANIQAEALLEQQIVTFFGGNDLKMYDEFYGVLPKDTKNWDTLTKDQRVNRWQVLEMADQMLIGAGSQGREMDVDEALTLAHLSISEPTREKVIRDEIKAKVVKRNKSLTLKPSGGKKPDAGKPATEQEFINVTRERLDNIYKK